MNSNPKNRNKKMNNQKPEALKSTMPVTKTILNTGVPRPGVSAVGDDHHREPKALRTTTLVTKTFL